MKINIRSVMREIAIAGITLFIFSNIISCIRRPEISSTQLPQLEVKLLDDTIYKIKKGKPLVIHFWATWCPACKLEAGNIETLSKKYDVLSVAVNSGNGAKIKTYMQQRGLTFRVVNDTDGALAKKFNVDAFPTTFIYSAGGELKFTEVGYTSTIGLLARVKTVNL